ncbi:hybrid sensor histidine kinase/response regulator [Paucibacter soli]|uniref:hybrid sensor histidine kinase/response regulator n=1 Tax=Paucibacter soli TaxID=3133433 RepID=UPI0030B041CC
MDFSRDSEFPPDLSPLAWVQEELRRSLESVHKTLRRALREADARVTALGLETQPSQPLQAAAAQLHQLAGVLSLVGLPAGALVLRAAEQAVERLALDPVNVDPPSVQAVERADFALLSLIAKLLAGNKTSTLALFPSYRALQQLNGVERIHPADLAQQEWSWRELPADAQAPALSSEQARAGFEATLLKQMRAPSPQHAQHLSDLCAGLAQTQPGAHGRSLWALAAAHFEAQALGLLKIDALVKRLGSRLLAQLRAGAQGDAAVSERLAQDLLFFCSQAEAPAASQHAPRLLAVRRAYALNEGEGPTDYEDDSLGHIDPSWVSQARKRVAQAKESWSSAAEGESHRLAGLDEQFAAVGDSIERLFPSGEVLGQTLRRAVVATLRSGKPPEPTLAMEIATSLLYVEAALDDEAFDHPDQAERVIRLARRVEAASRGEPAAPLEAWMEDLYRRVSDRQTLGSVVHELRSSLSEVERQVDEYFRDPSQRQLLIPVPNQLGAMRGVFSVLGVDQGALTCVRMRDQIDELANTEVDPSRSGPREQFERLASNLGALGFLIDMLSVQPQLAKRMFRFDEASGSLISAVGRERLSKPVASEPSLLAQVQAAAQAVAEGERPQAELARDLERLTLQARAADETALANAAQSAQRLLEEPGDTSALPLTVELTEPAEPTVSAEPAGPSESEEARAQAAQSLNDFLAVHVPAAVAPVAAGAPAPEIVDEEMLEIFLEEATEVLANARVALAELELDAANREQLTNVRRAFHTLKGSSRMVGLKEFGEGAWAFEQLYNARLGEQGVADAALLSLSRQALDYLAAWSAEIAAKAPVSHHAEVLRTSADAMRLEQRLLPLGAAAAEPAVEAALEPVLELPIELPEVPASVPPAEAEPDQHVDTELLPIVEVAELSHAETEMLGLELNLDLPAAAASVSADFELPEFELKLDLGEEPAAPAPALPPPDEELTLDLGALELPAVTEPEPEPAAAPEPEPEPEPEPADEPLPESELLAPSLELVGGTDVEAAAEPIALDEAEPASDEGVKLIGPLRISITLFNIFLNEADELSRRLCTELSEWALDLGAGLPASCEPLAHALAGNAGTVGFDELSALARALEHALERAAQVRRLGADEARLFNDAAEEIRRLLHQFAAGFLKNVEGDLTARLQAYQPPPEDMVESLPSELPEDELSEPPALPIPRAADDFEVGLPDQIDDELFPIFEEEAPDLLRDLQAGLRDWMAHPGDVGRAGACMRALHTFKGGARLTGAMRLGEAAHLLESAIEALLHQGQAEAAEVRALQEQGDALEHAFDTLKQARLAPKPVAQPEPELPPADAPHAEVVPLAETAEVAEVVDSGPAAAQIDWSRFSQLQPSDSGLGGDGGLGGAQALVRVRGALLERMAAQAGEVSIRRARLESELGQMKGALLDLDDNLDRLRSQLRELELQAEAQMGAQEEAAKHAAKDFDPLEFDRYTRFQELTRMLAESVNDVATVQRSLQRNVQTGEDELAAQSRLTRELQDDLLRTRMVEFDSLSERMHRVVRLAARETGKQVQLLVNGAQVELDRSVLERLVGSFEHLLRNSVMHGIEPPVERVAKGKPELGTIQVQLAQEGNEVVITVRDDGRGLDLARIRERGLKQGLIQPDATPSDEALMQLIFAPGFSTATEITELAGRGVGMDVVRAEVNTLGGYIDLHSTPGQGAAFELRVPLTTALTQVVVLRYGEQSVAVPASLMESVQRISPAQVEQAYETGELVLGGERFPFYWLGGLMKQSERGMPHGKTLPVAFVRSAHQRLAVHVDEVLGNQEVVVKNLGPQLVHVPGLAGISLLASGEVALIYNPVALANRYGAQAQAAARHALDQAAAGTPAASMAAAEALAPLVLVVDDSLTVRRVTQRLLEREGYRVHLAKDGLEAMERLAEEELPAVVLTDIEMPRMDGFDLVRNLRADSRLAELPVIMITSRIAQKHRDYAHQLGVDDYLGKPYDEELLLSLIARYTARLLTV